VSGDQVIVAAEVTNAANDSTMFVPMVTATEANLEAAGAQPPETFAADTGYWSAENLTVETSAELLITPMPATKGKLDHDRSAIERRAEVFAHVEAGTITLTDAAEELGISYGWANHLLDAHRHGRRDPAVLRQEMRDRLETDAGRARYAMRKITTEPVFGNIKANLRHRRFSGRGMSAVESEWRLICSVHNLLKVRNRRLAVG
jgi:hypothetical protein